MFKEIKLKWKWVKFHVGQDKEFKSLSQFEENIFVHEITREHGRNTTGEKQRFHQLVVVED